MSRYKDGDVGPRPWLSCALTLAAMIIMALRLLVRKVRGQQLNTSDVLTIFCKFFLAARCSTIHAVLLLGSNDVNEAFRKNHVFGVTEIYQREIGGRLILVNRTFYNS